MPRSGPIPLAKAHDLIATVSHDMRVPIATIKGCAETLRRGALVDRRYRGRFIRAIERHADLLLDLVEDLLSLSALNRRQPCASGMLSLAEEAASAIRDLQVKARSSKVSLRARIDPGLHVAADKRHLSQVLQNLLVNAIKYNRRGGQVRVSARPVGSMVSIDVSDTGIGIEPAELSGLFHSFHRTAAARKHCHGTGLGLSIVRRIVEGYGGSAWVESAAGEGSTFSFTLPASLIACRRRMWSRCRRRWARGAPPCAAATAGVGRESRGPGSGLDAAMAGCRARFASFRSRRRACPVLP